MPHDPLDSHFRFKKLIKILGSTLLGPHMNTVTAHKKSRLKRWGIVVLCFGLLTCFICFTGVDHKPYLESHYYKQTLTAIEQTTPDDRLATLSTLYVGTGKSSIIPAISGTTKEVEQGIFPGLPLGGYGARRGAPATGTLDPLYVKALWLKSGGVEGAVVAMDMLTPPFEMIDLFREEVSNRLGLPPGHFYFGATHSHGGPGGWAKGMVGEAFAGPYESGFNLWLKERVFESLETARKSLQPASIAFSETEMPDWVHNRLVHENGIEDPMLQSLFIQPESGPLITIGSFSAHATVMGSDSMQFCGDYPGHWANAVENETGGFAMFLAGGVGSHSPTVKTKGHSAAEDMGQALARQTVQQWKIAEFAKEPTLSLTEWDIHLPEPHVRVVGNVRLRPWLAKKLLPTERSVPLPGLRLGNVLLIGTPCDFSGELAAGLREHFQVGGFHSMITSFNGDYIGYVVPQKYYYLNAYESKLMSFYGPSTAPYLTDMVRRLGHHLMDTVTP
jgi:neutral ceramidase